MPERTPILAANWKMHKTVEEAESFLADLLPRVPESGAEVVICPAFPSLSTAVERCAESPARVAAQNMHEEPSGAFTGEVSAPMLVDLGVDGVVLGHSERRQYFGETDEALALKVPAALVPSFLFSSDLMWPCACSTSAKPGVSPVPIAQTGS